MLSGVVQKLLELETFVSSLCIMLMSPWDISLPKSFLHIKQSRDMISLDTIHRMFCVINLRSSRRPAFGPDYTQSPPPPPSLLESLSWLWRHRVRPRQVQITLTLISKQKYSASPQGQDHSYCFSENLVNVITHKELDYLGLGTRCRVGLGPGTLHFCLIAYSHHELNWHS